MCSAVVYSNHQNSWQKFGGTKRAWLRCRPWRASARLRPPPCPARFVLPSFFVMNSEACYSCVWRNRKRGIFVCCLSSSRPRRWTSRSFWQSTGSPRWKTARGCTRRSPRRRLLAETIRALEEEYGNIVLFADVGKRNIASLQTHLRAGFVREKETWTEENGETTDRRCTMAYRSAQR